MNQTHPPRAVEEQKAATEVVGGQKAATEVVGGQKEQERQVRQTCRNWGTVPVAELLLLLYGLPRSVIATRRSA